MVNYCERWKLFESLSEILSLFLAKGMHTRVCVYVFISFNGTLERFPWKKEKKRWDGKIVERQKILELRILSFQSFFFSSRSTRDRQDNTTRWVISIFLILVGLFSCQSDSSSLGKRFHGSFRTKVRIHEPWPSSKLEGKTLNVVRREREYPLATRLRVEIYFNSEKTRNIIRFEILMTE